MDDERERLLVTLENIGKLYEGLVLKANFAPSEAGQAAICLSGTIAELIGATTIVLRSKYQTHAPVLMRCMLEALADLKCLATDPSYVDRINMKNAKQMTKILHTFKRDTELQADEETLHHLDHEYADHKAIFDQLKKKARRGNLWVVLAAGFRLNEEAI
jgi:hypothetical protein